MRDSSINDSQHDVFLILESYIGLQIDSVVVTVISRWNNWYTVECHYNAVQYFMILHTTILWQEQNWNQISKSQKTPHTSPLRARGGMSFPRILGKIDRAITAPHCIHIPIVYSYLKFTLFLAATGVFSRTQAHIWISRGT